MHRVGFRWGSLGLLGASVNLVAQLAVLNGSHWLIVNGGHTGLYIGDEPEDGEPGMLATESMEGCC